AGRVGRARPARAPGRPPRALQPGDARARGAGDPAALHRVPPSRALHRARHGRRRRARPDDPRPRRHPLHRAVGAALGRGGGRPGPHLLGRHRECAAPLRQRLHRQRDREPRLHEARAQAPHLPGRRLPGGRLRRAPRAHLPARARPRRAGGAHPRGARGTGGRRARGRDRRLPARGAGARGAGGERLGRAAGPRGGARDPREPRDRGARGAGGAGVLAMSNGVSRAWRVPARPRRLLLVAGEASGDLHGADLVRALRASVPELEVFGVGGERLREAGMETVADVGEVATMGLKATGRLRALWHAYRTLARRLRADPPDLCVLIDFPEFNLRLARVAKRAGVPVLYYIGPQVWAWRRGRVRKIARRVDRLAVVFPFEPALYAGRLRGVEFVGHPLLDRVRVTRGRTETLRAHGLDPARRTVLLLPGSRPSEIDYLLPRLLDAVRLLGADQGLQFPLALAHTLSGEELRRRIAAAALNVRVIEGDTYNLIGAADVALVSSGTATLE